MGFLISSDSSKLTQARMIMLILGVSFFLGGSSLVVRTAFYRLKGVETQARIVDQVPGYRGSFCPILEYKVEDKIYQVIGFYCAGPYTIGTVKTILYIPQDPKSIDEKAGHSSDFIFLFIGIVLLVVRYLLKSGEPEAVPELPYDNAKIDSNEDEIPSDIYDK